MCRFFYIRDASVSDRAMRAIRTVQNVTGPQKAVLMVIADHADDTGYCFLSVDTIATESCFCERSVRSALRGLEAAGCLQNKLTKGLGYQFRLLVDLARDSNDLANASSDLAGDAFIPPSHLESRSSDLARGASDLARRSESSESPSSDLAGDAPKDSLKEQRTERAATAPTLFPTEFYISSEMKLWLKQHCPYVMGEDTWKERTATFAEHYRSKGERRPDWVAAWRGWMVRDETQLKAKAGGKPPAGEAWPPLGAPRIGTPEFDREMEHKAFIDKWYQTEFKKTQSGVEA